MSPEDAILVEETLAHARARRAEASAAAQVDEARPPGGAPPDIDLVAEERADTQRLDAERPLGSS